MRLIVRVQLKAAGVLLLACGSVLLSTARAQSQTPAPGAAPAARPDGQTERRLRPAEERERREQPGAAQGAVTTSEFDATPKFSMEYFVGEWKFEAMLADSAIGQGGPISGSEVIRNVWDGRFYDVAIAGEAPEGPFTGKGVMMYQDTFAGQSFARYEFTRGMALLRAGSLGCDLGATCNMYFETPPVVHNGATVRLKGRFYLTSPFAFRVSTEISENGGPYRNLGTAFYTKNERVKPEPIR